MYRNELESTSNKTLSLSSSKEEGGRNKGKRFKRTPTLENKGTGLYFVLPSLIGVAVFVLIPFLDVVRRSLSTAMGNEYVGIKNYETIFSNEAFLLAAKNTLTFIAVCLPLLLSLSLGLALVLYEVGKKAGFFKTVFLVPMAIPVASIVLLWRVVFADQGILNGWLTNLGVAPESWMNSDRAFWVLVGSYLWKNIGYDVVLWLAGLAGINESLFEAARVDGAGSFRIFWQITLPNLLPSLYTILVLSLINIFKVFREAYLLSGDYPHSSIYQLQHLFNNWFRELSMDKLSAAAVVTALATLLIILVLRRSFEEE